MKYLKIKITKFVSNDFPGFIECSFLDINGKEQRCIEKIPMVSKRHIDQNSDFPIEEYLPVEILKQWDNKQGLQVATIKILNGISAMNGQTQFDIAVSQMSD